MTVSVPVDLINKLLAHQEWVASVELYMLLGDLRAFLEQSESEKHAPMTQVQGWHASGLDLKMG